MTVQADHPLVCCFLLYWGWYMQFSSGSKLQNHMHWQSNPSHLFLFKRFCNLFLKMAVHSSQPSDQSGFLHISARCYHCSFQKSFIFMCFCSNKLFFLLACNLQSLHCHYCLHFLFSVVHESDWWFVGKWTLYCWAFFKLSSTKVWPLARITNHEMLLSSSATTSASFLWWVLFFVILLLSLSQGHLPYYQMKNKVS